MSIGLEKTEATAEAVPPTRASNAVDLPESLLCSIPGSAEKAAAMEGRRTKRDGGDRSWVAERNDAANARKGRGSLAFSGRVCEAQWCVCFKARFCRSLSRAVPPVRCAALARSQHLSPLSSARAAARALIHTRVTLTRARAHRYPSLSSAITHNVREAPGPQPSRRAHSGLASRRASSGALARLMPPKQG